MTVQKKYMWVPISFEKEIENIQKKISEENNLKIEKSDIVFHLGEDLKKGNISIRLPIIRFNKVPSMRLGNEIKKIKRLKKTR